MYTDKTLVCKDCGNEFVFTAGEQEFYAEKGFQNEPTRCNAASPPRFLSSPGKIALSTAARAMQRVVVNPQRT